MTVFLGGKDAFSFAFTEYTDTVFRIAVHNTDCTADAEDITQEAFTKLLQSQKIFRDGEHIKAWLIRVTLNLCTDERRKKSRLSISDEPIPERTADIGGSVLEYVKALPENYRNAIYLHYYEGYTAKEIAKLLGSKESTVLSWLSRGRAALRNEMIGGFDDE